jgi:CheY-like chemotaxis protein
VLCVEDNVNLLLSRRSAIHTAVTASTAAEGLALARQVLPELMLLDTACPASPRPAGTVKRRLRSRAIPTVAVTANAMPADAERALKAGFDDFLPKPIDLALFDAMLQRIPGVPEAEPICFAALSPCHSVIPAGGIHDLQWCKDAQRLGGGPRGKP